MKFGADNSFKKLRAVLVAKPLYFDIATLETPWQKKWFGRVDRDLAIKEHENMCIALENEGVKCHFLNPVKGDTDQKDTRDVGIISSKGAIVATQKHMDVKKGEDIAFIAFCDQNNIPVLNRDLKIRFEGGDFFFIDETIAILGIGVRTIEESAKIIQKLLHRPILFIQHKSPHHLDVIFNVISKNLVVCNKSYLDEEIFQYLKDKQIIPVFDVESMPTNFLLLEENKIMADSGCHEFNKKLEEEGVEVIEVDVSELKKNGGGIRCMTLPILRE